MSESQTSTKLPVLDISKPLNPSSLSAIAVACKTWGFFHIANHGISKEFFENLRCLTNHIFNLPLEVKLNAGPSSATKTYTPHFIASPFFESLRVSGPDFFASAMASSEAILNNPNPELSFMLQEYGNKMMHLGKIITEVVLAILGSDFDKKFISEFKNCHGYLRMNNYTPPPSSPPGNNCMKQTHEEEEKEEVEGLGMHTDMSCITIVYQDGIGGLQVRSKEDPKWMDIHPCEDTLVVNIGDLMQAWSNGRLRSSEHRVVLRRQSCVNRFSIAFFWCFEDEKMIYAPEDVVGEENSRIYKPFLCGDYLKFRQSNEKGKFEKVGFTVNHYAGT